MRGVALGSSFRAMRSLGSSSLRRSQPTRVLRSLGSRPYSVRVLGGSPEAISTVRDLISTRPRNSEGLEVQVDGWVKNVRKSSAVRFVDISDGSCSAPLQAIVPKTLAQDIQFGAAVRLKGSWKTRDLEKETEDASQQVSSTEQSDVIRGDVSKDAVRPPELQVAEVELLGQSNPATYPIQRKYATAESLRSIPHLRMRTPLNSAMLRLRSDTLNVLSEFFSQEKFQQTQPPIITSSDCEGAGETFRVEAGTPKDPFSKNEQYLTVSSQLHLEAFAQALGNVWTLSPTFRAERSDTSRHLSEFYMLEGELGFVDDMEDVMDFIQKMLRSLVSGLSQRDAWQELESFRLHPRDPTERQSMTDLDGRDVLERRWNGLLAPERWPRIAYTDAIKLLQDKSSGFEFPPQWGKSLQSEHERYLAETIGFDKARNAYAPVFVTHYPQAIKAFYMRQAESNPTEGPVFDCFDLIVPDLGELAGGSMREHRLQALTANMNQFFGKELPALDWYMDLRRWGCPPHGGFGIGFDRLLSYLTGVKSIRDIVAFPRLYGHIHC